MTSDQPFRERMNAKISAAPTSSTPAKIKGPDQVPPQPLCPQFIQPSCIMSGSVVVTGLFGHNGRRLDRAGRLGIYPAFAPGRRDAHDTRRDVHGYVVSDSDGGAKRPPIVASLATAIRLRSANTPAPPDGRWARIKPDAFSRSP